MILIRGKKVNWPAVIEDAAMAVVASVLLYWAIAWITFSIWENWLV